MTAPMPPRLLHGTRLRVDLAHYFPPLLQDIQQLLRSSRRNVSPVELIDGPFLMGHEYLTGALVERREIAKTSARSNGVLHHAPEAFDRIEMVTTMGR